ncbi:PREDICTED: cysteine proteinase inhibitor 6 [Nicotiana attenuata]|uniref:Cysteine proteinase inhibitor n=1 Tax=Nicotiana attenuata TaxID=49451 RepID=A0A1J6IQK1_NICAT|nr:PREDICTED: cysteine proteinase inhibitor 6 [Nicotiana attenuata]OIS97424.1 cysteine proteinase inhibitor 6 [Nicotiana attenuata]
MRVFRKATLLFALILSFSFLFSAFGLSETGGGFCGEEEEKESNLIEMATLGGIRDSHASSQNSDEIHNLAKFAVDEHNKKENAMIELARVVKAQEQVVAGTLHHLTLEVIDAGKKKLYEAKVWVKPWLNFKELQEFTHVEDVPTLTSSDLGVKQEEEGSGLKSVPVHDPVVQEAAEHAIKTIQQRSNSLLPYELQEVVHANAEVIGEDNMKLHMLIKTSRGGKLEKFKVQVHHNNEGAFQLNHMEPDHS